MNNQNQPHTLLEMLFENRNKTYGAYHLRTTYSSTLTKAFAAGVLLVLTLVMSSFVYVNYSHNPSPVVEKPLRIVDIELDRILLPEKPKEEKPKASEPVMQQYAQVKFVAQVEPVSNESPEESIPSKKELDVSHIGNKNIEGEKLTIMIPPAPPMFPTIGDLGNNDDKPVSEDKEVFLHVEKSPSFAGGETAMYKWLSKNLKYPRLAQSSGVEGTVFVAFIVEKDGSISNIQILKGIGFGCDDETKNVINKMPKWDAGQQNGQNVRVRFTIPIKFKMN